MRESFLSIDNTYVYDNTDLESSLDMTFLNNGKPYDAGSKGVMGFKVPYIALYGFGEFKNADDLRAALKGKSTEYKIDDNSIIEFWRDTKSAILKFDTLKLLGLKPWLMTTVGSSSDLANTFMFNIVSNAKKVQNGILKTGKGYINDPLNKISPKTKSTYNNMLSNKSSITGIPPMHRSFVHGMFELSPEFKSALDNIDHPVVTIADDVYTSGFTLADSARLIMEHRPDAEVSAIFLISSNPKTTKHRIMRGTKNFGYGKIKLERYSRFT